MKILLRPRLCSDRLSKRLAADPALARALGAAPNGPHNILFKKFFDTQGPLLDDVLAHAHAVGEPMDFLRDLQFTTAEVAAASHLEVVCRKTIGQTDSESRTTLDEYDRDALHPTHGRWRVRLPRHVYLARPVPPDSIAHVDQYTGEYVLGSTAAKALQGSGLSGWRLQPVLHWKSRMPLPDTGMHLTSGELLPPALPTATTFETFDDGPRAPSTPRRHGAIAYAAGALRDTPDFARTSEPWCDWGTPMWVVRQRVRTWYGQAALKGWAFWPVLEEGSALQAEHEEKWAQLRATLEAAKATLFA